ncbi:hypothetical protein C4579_02870 [Candidatus Microgenomates bacterium]|nr:MAG: hypothetical protein C4579_02870 [Candidatus Microgenomates bacterium]
MSEPLKKGQPSPPPQIETEREFAPVSLNWRDSALSISELTRIVAKRIAINYADFRYTLDEIVETDLFLYFLGKPDGYFSDFPESIEVTGIFSFEKNGLLMPLDSFFNQLANHVESYLGERRNAQGLAQYTSLLRDLAKRTHFETLSMFVGPSQPGELTVLRMSTTHESTQPS